MTYHKVCNTTWQVPLVEQELLPLPEHQSWPPVFSGVHVTQSLVFCVVFWQQLFVLLSLFFWSLYCLSFGHCIVCLLVIVLSVFWPLYCLSFGHCVVCLLAIVLSVFWPLYCLSFITENLLLYIMSVIILQTSLIKTKNRICHKHSMRQDIYIAK
jgi:hypothetical protein